MLDLVGIKPIILVLAAVILYSIANVSIEKWLSQYSTTGLLVIWYPAMTLMALLALAYFKSAGQTVQFPVGYALVITAVVAVIYFFADFSFLNAYASGGNIFTITSLFLTFPVVAGTMKMLLDKQYPNFYQVAGYLLVVVAVVLFVKGSTTASQVQ